MLPKQPWLGDSPYYCHPPHPVFDSHSHAQARFWPLPAAVLRRCYRVALQDDANDVADGSQSTVAAGDAQVGVQSGHEAGGVAGAGGCDRHYY
jgi:hypothetical protein